MPPAAQFTAGERVNTRGSHRNSPRAWRRPAERVDALGPHLRSDADVVAGKLVQGADEAVRLMLEHGTAAHPTSAARNPDREDSVLPALARGNRNASRLSPVVNLPPPRARRAPTTSFHALQEWEGYVVERRAADFVARLTDLTAGASYEQEEAIIPLTELSDHDAARIADGSVFRWVIGYERSPAGTKKRVSQIVLRDLPAMTEADLRDGEKWAQETIRALGR